MTTSLAEQKAGLRKDMARQRKQAKEAAGGDLNDRLAASFAAVPLPEPSGGGAVASAYLPIRSELDPRPIMEILAAAGWRLALPVVVAAENPLLFRAYSLGDSLVRGRFDTEVPGEDKEALVPRLLIVPLLAFDRRGYRLGYGGGFYDRTLALLRGETRDGGTGVLAIGLAFAGQEIERVPTDAMDQRLDWIVTEREAIPIVAAS